MPREKWAAGVCNHPDRPVTQVHRQTFPDQEAHAVNSTPETAVRPVSGSRIAPALLWLTAALVIFAVLALHDHAVLAALAALGAVVTGTLAELLR